MNERHLGVTKLVPNYYLCWLTSPEDMSYYCRRNRECRRHTNGPSIDLQGARLGL